MTDQVDIPGIGGMDKRIVYTLVAGATTFVGYRWWRSRSAPAAAPGLQSGLAPDGATGVPGVGTPGSDAYSNPAPGRLGGSATGSTSFNAGSTSGSAPTTDQAWTLAVVADLSNLGYNPQTVSEALAAYLAGQALTTGQIMIVRQAWAFEGRPPGHPNLGVQSGGTDTPAPGSIPTATTGPVTMTVGKDHKVSEVIAYAQSHGSPQFSWADFWEYNPGIAGQLQWQPDGDWKFTGWNTTVTIARPGAIQTDLGKSAQDPATAA
jgi:hypothetical protein